MELVSKFLEFELFHVGEYHLKVINLAIAFLVILIANVLLLLIKKSIFRKKHNEDFNEGNSYSLLQIIKYIVWVIAIGFMLESLGEKATILIAGSAALLVGVGLGLQQTFNDIISGIILLSERSIKMGDILKIQKISLRTSTRLNTDDISIIIPNSLTQLTR